MRSFSCRKIFCACENAALPFSNWKTGVCTPVFCPFLHLRAERTSPSLRACTLYVEYDIDVFCTFCPFFLMGKAKKCFYSFCLSWHSTFFYHCQHLSGKALHGRARWSVFARPLYELFSFAFPAFGSSRKSAHAAFHFFAVPSLWSALFLFPFPLLCQIAAKKACSLMQWLTAPFFSPRLSPHKTIYRSPFPAYPFHLHAFAPLSAIQCPPALRFPARFRKTIMLLFSVSIRFNVVESFFLLFGPRLFLPSFLII